MSISISNTPLLKMVDSEFFEFTNWGETSAGIAACRIIYKSPDSDHRLYDYVDVEFDSKNHHHIMRTFGTKQLAGGNRTTENVYVYENLNVPVRVTSRYAGVGEPATIEVLFTELSSEPRPESEFTLTHYGLPEFAAPLEPISRYLVFSACGAVLIVSGLVYFFVKRKSF